MMMPDQEPYDSAPDTRAHIARVAEILEDMAARLRERGRVHDASKLVEPEKSAFDQLTPKLKGLTYGSDAYRACLRELKPALEHHYAANSHHPEHYSYLECNGCYKAFPASHDGRCDICGYGQFTTRPDITGMSLLDLVEMVADWKAAGERHADGSFAGSLAVNVPRFEIGADLISILENTGREMGWLDR